MKTIQFSNYGDSSVLSLTDTDLPNVPDENVLIKVLATSINPLDIKIRSGEMKDFMPVPLPFSPGLDVAGIVEMVGKKVSTLKVGDKVFATTFGATYSEFISLNADTVCKMAERMSFIEAAAAAVPLTTSYSVLIEEGNLKPGQTALVHGAAGGVGHILIQMAIDLGAKVIATATGNGLQFISSLGIDQAIDYKSDEQVGKIKGVDMVVDLVGGETQLESYQKIKPGGILLSTVMPVSEELAKEFGIMAKFVNATPSLEKLTYGKNSIERGAIKVKVFKEYQLQDAAEAQDFSSQKGINGKIVLNLG
ncbi:NADP-dependent oxidoreductase [Pedobacter mucosus]|uniref:NADP-dependent oxidoreductase n=1 Tax=Pedobacter mucosus TaxID=2895286 RepID=UPI001EE3C238|nr:NADP-dependent oxidoreductase [Pedobacter mucosus]UKT63029.1 NADP-dependent oxidoreductase [Pedobacter mucosus]